MRYVGLVRNVMLGREGLDRDVLLRLLHAAGGRDGVSCLVTGNLLFDAAPSRLDAVVRRLEGGMADVIGRREPVIVREAGWLTDFVAGDPFAGYPIDRWERAVTFLRRRAVPLDPALVPAVDDLEAVAVRPHELLVAGRRGVRRPGPDWLLPRQWRAEATTRSWSTVERLALRHQRDSIGSAPPVRAGRTQPRTTSIGSMPSAGGRSKPHTWA
jgi:uncharacterized protein (DUF1697 family)